jgi:hypothetical protein
MEAQMELIGDVAVSTFTRRRWWPASALSPMARSQPKCGPSRRPRRTFYACRSGWRKTSARVHLNQIDSLAAAIATIDAQVEEGLAPFRAAVELITSIPGIKNLSAHVIISEIGIDMSRFPSATHLISWACLCPRNDESAGKRRSNRVRKGAVWLKTTLVQCPWAAVKKKDSYLQAQFRITARRGEKKAILAVAASMLTEGWNIVPDSAAITSIAGPPTSKKSVWSNDWPISGTLWN